MANLSDIYVKIGVSGKPTEMDNVGCQGLFIESTEICTKEIAQLKATNEALREYAVHKKGCFQAKSVFRIIHCSCGLDTLLAGGKP